MSERPTAAAVIIATEVLTAKVQDANTPVLAQWLRRRGIRLARVVVIEDDLDAIATEVRLASAGYTHAFTSGGVGPTHDDVTMAGVARAFGVEVAPHPELLAGIAKIPPGPRRDGIERMCRVPQGVELLLPEGERWPTLRMRNTFLLPGVPDFFRRRLESLGPWVVGPPLHAATVVTSAAETDVVSEIDAVVARHPGVSIGSYPIFDAQGTHTRLTVDGADRGEVLAAVADFERSLPSGSVRDVLLPNASA